MAPNPDGRKLWWIVTNGGNTLEDWLLYTEDQLALKFYWWIGSIWYWRKYSLK